jgi:aminomethyltransferase
LQGTLPVLQAAPGRTNTLPLAPLHLKSGWHPAPVYGWTLPLWFGGLYDEQIAARTTAVMFDRSHLGRFYVVGEGASDVLDRVFATDPHGIPPRGVARAVVCREDGSIVDIATLCHLDPGRWLVITGPRAQVALLEAVEGAVAPGEDVLVRDRLPESVLLSVQGPNAAALLEQVLGPTLPHAVPAGEAHELLLGGYRALVARTSQIGEDGYWFLTSAEVGEHFWESAVNAGIVPAGLAAHDALRIEAGVLESPHETPAPATPAAAGLDALVQLDAADGSPRAFPGAAALRAAPPPERVVTGLRIAGRKLATRGSRVSAASRDVGACVAAAWSAKLGTQVAFAYLPPGAAGVTVTVDGEALPAEVVALPFLAAREGGGGSGG